MARDTTDACFASLGVGAEKVAVAQTHLLSNKWVAFASQGEVHCQAQLVAILVYGRRENLKLFHQGQELNHQEQTVSVNMMVVLMKVQIVKC